LDRLCERLHAGEDLVPIEADLARMDEIGTAVKRAAEALGGLDVLCNVAGVQVRKPASQLSAEDWQHVVDVNLRATFFASQRAEPHLRASRGAIVNIASITSVRAIQNVSVYAATKAAVAQVTRSLAIEWAEAGIRVNAIAPGYIRTPLTRDVLEDPKRSAWLLERIPMRRFGEPEDVVGPALFLASDASAYVTGAVLFVDGGWTAW
jgi:NAD(P)-dependent dehydrogenase (short-subunit alcohol dehydrogenase family)